MAYLVFGDTQGAGARSRVEAAARGCSSPTEYWWPVMVNSALGKSALVIAEAGDYGPDNLTGAEQASLVSDLGSDPNWAPL